ncbi:DUF1877 family protein [Actinoplanes philippinensis]|uniref:DUF1877 family protein n=1 Tax=Actinoplanes philippinensis TaxID=35752 RepID=UPI0011601B4F|nr:DUF1877 family protein [Actinoplanes philippinensis]
MRCIALPLESGPVRALRADPALQRLAEDQPPFTRRWPDEVLPRISEQLLAVVPDDTKWSLDFFESRNFDQAEYLLDPIATRTIKSWPQRERMATYRAIFGAQRFALYTSDGCVTPWRCSSPAELTAAARLIDELDVAAVRREFSVADMLELGLYKVHPEDDDTESFTRALGDLRAWADHCRGVAARDLGLVIDLF